MSGAPRAADSVLVLGGGIAGLQTAIDIAELGFDVHLVERTPAIGGRMAQLDKTFPTNDCSMCILAPKMIECANHDNVTLHTLAELTELRGRVGEFRAVIHERSRGTIGTFSRSEPHCSRDPTSLRWHRSSARRPSGHLEVPRRGPPSVRSQQSLRTVR